MAGGVNAMLNKAPGRKFRTFGFGGSWNRKSLATEGHCNMWTCNQSYGYVTGGSRRAVVDDSVRALYVWRCTRGTLPRILPSSNAREA